MITGFYTLKVDFTDSTIDDVINQIRDFHADEKQRSNELLHAVADAGWDRIREINRIVELCKTGK
jgi:hypothetical protein